MFFHFKRYIYWIAVIALANACTESATTEGVENTSAQLTYDSTLVLPEGFKAIVVSEKIGRARHIAVNTNGDVYVQLGKLQDENGLVAMRDTNADGKADIIKRFGGHTGTGIAIHNGYLYCSSDESVFRYTLEEGELVPKEDSRVLIVSGFPEQRQHASKPFTFDNEGNIYVTVGGPSNACMETMRTKGSPGLDPCPQLVLQGGIWKFSEDKLAQNHEKDGHRYATGIRNAVALDWNPVTNQLYALQHGRDQLGFLYDDLFTEEESSELPAEEFLAIQDGDDFGWPYCYFDHYEDKKLLAPEYGGDRKVTGRCEAAKDPILAFPGHYGPNDLIFYTGDQYPASYKNGAFVAFHGSWNRAPFEQKGYQVAFVPFSGNEISGEWQSFAEGFKGVETLKSPSDAKHRPTGLAQGPDGSIYISDSVQGKIWKIVYTG